jgi:hypothetical protein
MGMKPGEDMLGEGVKMSPFREASKSFSLERSNLDRCCLRETPVPGWCLLLRKESEIE